MFIFSIILPTILAYLIVSILLNDDKQVSVLERLAISYPLGIGLLTTQIMLLGFAKIQLRLPVIVSLIVFEIVCALIWVVYHKMNIFSQIPQIKEKSKSNKYQNMASYFLITWISLKLATVFLETYLRPIYTFDTFTNWSVRAKVFFHSSSLLLDPASYDFFGRGIIHSSANYPPMNPLAQMWTALWLGSFDEVYVKIWVPFFLLSATIYLYKVASRDTNRLTSLTIVAIFISSPLISAHATETMSDFPLAVYILFAVSALQKVVRGRWAFLPLAGLFSVCGMLLKGEGLFIAIPLFMSCCYLVWSEVRSGKRSLSSLITPLLLPYLLVLPWFVFRSIYKLGNGADDIYLTIVFRPLMLIEYFWLIIGLQNFNVVFVFIPIMLACYGKFDRELYIVMFTVGFYVMFFLSLYVFVSYYTDGSKLSECVFRNALTYYPAALLIVILLIKRLLANFYLQPDSSNLTENI